MLATCFATASFVFAESSLQPAIEDSRCAKGVLGEPSAVK